jgi:hypothetical protein
MAKRGKTGEALGKYDQALKYAPNRTQRPDWLDKLPTKVKENAASRGETALKDTWLEGEKADLLGFVDFGV